MQFVHRRKLFLFASIILIAICAPVDLRADSLRIAVSTESFQLYEPIVLDLTLQLDQPYREVRDDPREATRQQRKLQHRLVVELLSDGEKLCDAPLSGGGFKPHQEQQAEFQMTALGVLGTRELAKPRNLFIFWDEPGTYVLRVRDRDGGLRSNEIVIQITEPADHQAANLFQEGGTDSILLLRGREPNERQIPSFEALAADHPNSTHGRYAAMCLLLRRTDPEVWGRRRDEMKPEKFRSMRDELAKAARYFDRGHPLRNKALFHLAIVEMGRGATGNPEEPLRRLMSETSDGSWIRRAKNALKEAAQSRERQAKAFPDEAKGQP